MPTISVTLCSDPFDPEKWVRDETDNFHEYLQERFPMFPPDARIYHEQVAEENDVTPRNEAGIKALGEMEGHFYVVLFPSDPVSIIVAVVAVVAVAAVALAPEVPNVASPDLNNQRQQAPNNQIARRQNRERIGSRIPDIFGTVRAFPDLLSVPYRTFIGNIEYEYAYMCLGRGEYDIEADTVREGSTMLSQIGGTSVEIYDPNTSPNSGDAPYLTVGTGVNDRVNRVDRATGVRNQVLIPANVQGQVGANNIMFQSPNLLVSSTNQDFPNKLTAGTDLTIDNAEVTVPFINQTAQTFNVTFGSNLSARYYAEDGLNVIDFQGSATQIDDNLIPRLFFNAPTIGVGDVLRVQSGPGNIDMLMVFQSNQFDSTRLRMYLVGEVAWSAQVTTQTSGSLRFTRRTSESIDFGGTYRIDSLTNRSIRFAIPRASRRSAAPNAILSFPFAALDQQARDRTTPTTNATIRGDVDRWVGPFVVESARRVVANFVASSGLYSDSGNSQTGLSVVVELESREIRPDAPMGGQPTTYRTTLTGSDEARSLVASTLDVDLGRTGKWSLRARRVTETNLDFQGSYIDEIRWRDMYGLTPVEQTDFGNVTTIHAVTQATDQTSGGANRNLNMLATRCVQRRGEGPLIASDRADDILSSVCLDPYIGNRTNAEIDFDNFYDTLEEVRDYFGTDKAGEFGYTFDKNNLSFEDIVFTIAQAVFCVAYREGNVIRLKFERATNEAGFLFNHANKIPGTDVRSRRFGNANGNDGVEFQWIDPDDSDVRASLYYPTDRSAIRPLLVESLGVRNREQAFLHANRIWSKVQHQNLTTEFQGTREAIIVSRPDRILVADNTRQGTQDGTVIAQDGLSLELSEPVDLTGTGPYTIFLQHTDGTTEGIVVTAGATSKQVMLANAPKQALNTDVSTYARSTYIIGDGSQSASTAFLVGEKRIRSISTASIRAVNYDEAYYLEDGSVLRLDAEQGYVNAGFLASALTSGADTLLPIDDGRFSVGNATTANGGIGFQRAPNIIVPYSVSVNIALTSTNGFANLIGIEGDQTLNEPMFIVNRTGFGLSSKAGIDNSADQTFTTNREYHVAATYDGEAVRLYVDGVEVEATRRITNLKEAPTSVAERVNIGDNSTPAFRFCNFNNLRLYNRVLLPEQIARLASLNI